MVKKEIKQIKWKTKAKVWKHTIVSVYFSIFLLFFQKDHKNCNFSIETNINAKSMNIAKSKTKKNI